MCFAVIPEFFSKASAFLTMSLFDFFASTFAFVASVAALTWATGTVGGRAV